MRSISFAATATATALAAATAGVGLLVTAPGAASADATKSSAYGLQASGGGEVVVPPTPYVESTDGTNKTAGGGSLPANPLGVAATIGQLSAGDDFASVELTDLGVAPSAEQLPAEVQAALTQLQDGCTELTAQLPDGDLPLPDPLPPELQTAIDELTTQINDVLGEASPLGDAPTPADLESFCESFDAAAPLVTARALSVECQGDIGKFELIGVEFLGQEVPLPSPVEPGTAILPENPLLTITANQQTKNADGSFSIDGLNVQLAGGEAEVIVANATCGEPIAAPATDTPAPPAAPAPAPVAGSAPVTG